jgi:hypothetical protein
MVGNFPELVCGAITRTRQADQTLGVDMAQWTAGIDLMSRPVPAQAGEMLLKPLRAAAVQQAKMHRQLAQLFV